VPVLACLMPQYLGRGASVRFGSDCPRPINCIVGALEPLPPRGATGQATASAPRELLADQLAQQNPGTSVPNWAQRWSAADRGGPTTAGGSEALGSPAGNAAGALARCSS